MEGGWFVTAVIESWPHFFSQASQFSPVLDPLPSSCQAPSWGLDSVSYSQLLTQVLLKMHK